MPRAKSGQSRHLLILRDKSFGLARNFLGRDFHRNLALHTVFINGFCRTHIHLSVLTQGNSWLDGPAGFLTRLDSHAVPLSLKTEERSVKPAKGYMCM